MAAAVADFRPAVVADHKIKKDELAALTAPDDRARADPRHPRRPRAATSAPGSSWSASPPRPTTCVANARKKLERKNLDLIVANDVGRPGRRLRARHQRRRARQGRRRATRCPPDRQAAVARAVLDAVVALRTA